MSTIPEAADAVRTFRAPQHIADIAPYQAGKPIEELAREFGLDPENIVKLASNENPLGIPATAQQALTQAISGLGRYPDANGFDLKSVLATHYRIPAAWLTLGNGS